MKPLMLAIVTAAALVAMVVGGRADAEYPYCAALPGGYGAGTVTCGYATLQQCRATISGMGGTCLVNPQFAGPPGPYESARRRARGPHS